MPRQSKKDNAIQTEWPEHYRVFGADLSLKRPGFCLMELSRQNNETKIVNIKTASVDNKTKNKTHGQLLMETAIVLKEFLQDNLLPTFYVREHAFSGRGAASDQGVFETVGISNLVLWQTQGQIWKELYPVTIKRLLTGSGKATKPEVAEAVQKIVGHKMKFACDDESDACAVAIAWLLQAGQLTQNISTQQEVQPI